MRIDAELLFSMFRSSIITGSGVSFGASVAGAFVVGAFVVGGSVVVGAH